jgi:hypothetical protein
LSLPHQKDGREAPEAEAGIQMKCPYCRDNGIEVEMEISSADGDMNGSFEEWDCFKCKSTVEVQRIFFYGGKPDILRKKSNFKREKVLCGEVALKKGIPLQMNVGTTEINGVLEKYEGKKIYLKISEC